MKYLGWAVFYEGNSDAQYLDVLIPRIIREVIAHSDGDEIIEVPDQPAVRFGAHGRDVDLVAKEICSFTDAFEIVFVHADTGGRGLQNTLPSRSTAYCEAVRAECNLANFRCICLTPSRETEAWILADGPAILEAVGITGNPSSYGLPVNAHAAERLVNPKATLNSALDAMRVRERSRNLEVLYPSIANRQSLDQLYGSVTVRGFRDRLRGALRAIQFIE